jgi:hypothetical protein
MNTAKMEQATQERYEPLGTVLDLLVAYGAPAVLKALACAAEHASKDPEFCHEVHREAEFLLIELSEMFERYELLFSYETAQQAVIYHGTAVPV